MRPAGKLMLCLFCVALAATVWAQREKREPLTGVEIEKIREAGIYPVDRVKIYAEIVDEHVNRIKGLGARAHTSARVAKLDNELQDLAALVDEFGSNLDQYNERKADIQKSVTKLNEMTPKWMEALEGLRSEPGFDISRTEAIESMKDLAEQAAEIAKDQTTYFKEHKDQRGQERYEPPPK